MEVGVAGLLVAVLRDGVGDDDRSEEVVSSVVEFELLDRWLSARPCMSKVIKSVQGDHSVW